MTSDSDDLVRAPGSRGCRRRDAVGVGGRATRRDRRRAGAVAAQPDAPRLADRRDARRRPPRGHDRRPALHRARSKRSATTCSGCARSSAGSTCISLPGIPLHIELVDHPHERRAPRQDRRFVRGVRSRRAIPNADTSVGTIVPSRGPRRAGHRGKRLRDHQGPGRRGHRDPARAGRVGVQPPNLKGTR